MSNNIIDFIKKQGGLFNASKYFGGINKLRELSKTDSELESFIEGNSKGWLTIRAGNGKRYDFDYYLLDYETDDPYDDLLITLYVNLIVEYPNLNNEELMVIGKWTAEYCEDDSPYTVSTPKNLVNENDYAYYMVVVKEINGKPVPWKLNTLLNDPETVVPDETADELIEKSKGGKEPVTESLIQLQNLFNKFH